MASHDLSNKSLGPYQIQSLLGRGGMATVHLARQTSMNRDVAIKIMSPELADDEQFVARFENEARVIAQLQHPHILPVIDFGREGKSIYIVMRLVRGGSLDQRLSEGPLPLRVASRMLDQIASALSFAHEQGIVHRDLKPNNVLLDERDNAYLTDFGIAKMLAGTSKLTATGNILGTPAYMAPEQWRGEPVDARTDIYSLGVMLFEMVLGQLPFEGDTPYTLMYKHFNDPPPAPRRMNPDIEPAIEAVILRALAKNADDRYQSPEAMAEEFAEAVRGALSETGSDRLDRTVLGPEAGSPPRVTPVTPLDDMATHTETPLSGPPVVAPPAGPRPPAASAGAQEPPPPARRRLNPLTIGAAVLAVIVLVAALGLLVLDGDDDPGSVVLLPTATETETATPTAEPSATPTDTPEPSATATDTPEPTATATATATPRTTLATVLSQRAGVRGGPGFDYEVIGSLPRDDEAVVLGVSDDGGWYQIAFEAGLGWISAETVQISGNPTIRVIVWPTRTPTATQTPTATETPLPTDTPVATATHTPTDTPAPTSTATSAPAPSVEPAFFVPDEFQPITLDAIDVALDYPTNWIEPWPSGVLYYMAPVEAGGDLSTAYPSVALARGTPDQLVAAGITSISTDPIGAVENPLGTDFTGKGQIAPGFSVPAYKLDVAEPDLHAWAWLFVLGEGDWLYLVSVAPTGELEQPYEDVLLRLRDSIRVDGRALVEGAAQPTPVALENTEQLADIPAQLGEAVLDRFDDNSNDWRFAEVVDGALLVAPTERDAVRWAFPFTLLEGEPAFYAQVTATLTSESNYYQYGLAFRVIDANNFYYFMVDHFQQYSVYKVENGEYSPLLPVTPHQRIRAGVGEPNVLGLLVIGDYYELYVNGDLVTAFSDRTHRSGSARPATFTFVDSDIPVEVTFDDFAYIPLEITGQPLLDQTGVVAVATAGSLDAEVLATPRSDAEVLVRLLPGQSMVALARTTDGAYLYGYGRGMLGWVASSAVELTRSGAPLAASALPVLDASAVGFAVEVWPVEWPEDESPGVTPAPPDVPLLEIGQATTETLEAGGDAARWGFTGTAGEVVTIAANASSTRADLAVALIGPDGQQLLFDDDSGPGLNPRVEDFELPVSGLYIVEISAVSGGGEYSVIVSRP